MSLKIIFLFTEVELDKNRTWCPRAGCETVCLVGPLDKSEINTLVAVTSPHAVQCPTCLDEFCSSCKKAVSRTKMFFFVVFQQHLMFVLFHRSTNTVAPNSYL